MTALAAAFDSGGARRRTGQGACGVRTTPATLVEVRLPTGAADPGQATGTHEDTSARPSSPSGLTRPDGDASEGARARACVALRRLAGAIDDAFIAFDAIRQGITARLWAASVAVDPDLQPCPECGEPDGAHLDCDVPALGRMTATERRAAFGEGQLR